MRTFHDTAQLWPVNYDRVSSNVSISYFLYVQTRSFTDLISEHIGVDDVITIIARAMLTSVLWLVRLGTTAPRSDVKRRLLNSLACPELGGGAFHFGSRWCLALMFCKPRLPAVRTY